ncbi:MAG: aminoglycoside phosphotransferase family protein [Phormidesmis sp.]
MMKAFDPTKNERLMAIAAHFVNGQKVNGREVIAIAPLGNGNINSTFVVTVSQGLRPASTQRFVLQRINTQVFRQPERVIQNMVVLNEHLKQTAADPSRRWETPQVLPTPQGANFWIDEEGGYWRAISFIENAYVLESVQDTAHAKEIGCGLAMFHRAISTLSPDRLADTLEGFHVTPVYLAAYERVLEKCDRTTPPMQSALVQHCLEFIAQRQAWASVLEQAKAAGHLHLRPIHGDPKVNNMMLGANGEAVGLIDLDTLKPGLVHYDIGDCLRSACNPLGEETEDWQNVVFDTNLARAMLQGYLSLARDFLTEKDYDYLYDAIRLIAFELGLRFFTDYLAGNRYFKVKSPTHNLNRALVQFQLTQSIEQQANTLKAIIQELR